MLVNIVMLGTGSVIIIFFFFFFFATDVMQADVCHITLEMRSSVRTEKTISIGCVLVPSETKLIDPLEAIQVCWRRSVCPQHGKTESQEAIMSCSTADGARPMITSECMMSN